MVVRRRVLSIQSHVVSGYVGNKAAVLPLQILGFDVDIINSVQFSNHTGYQNGFKGEALSGEQLSALIEGLKANNLLSQITHLLTGYIGTSSFLKRVAESITELKKHCTRFSYLCDPVLGDCGRLYVPEALVSIYREEVIGHASYLTPNSFELSQLSEMKVTSERDVFSACDKLHKTSGVPCIIVTSLDFAQKSKKVTITVSDDYGRNKFCIDAPRLPGKFTGSGDLTAALLLAWLDRCEGDVKIACMKAMASVNAVLKRTTEASLRRIGGSCSLPELELISSIPELINPPSGAVSLRSPDPLQ